MCNSHSYNKTDVPGLTMFVLFNNMQVTMVTFQPSNFCKLVYSYYYQEFYFYCNIFYITDI